MFENGVDFYDTPLAYIASYNVARVPYIIYQEEGFKHYLSGKMVTKNKDFIKKKTISLLNSYKQGDIIEASDIIKDRNSILTSRGDMKRGI